MGKSVKKTYTFNILGTKHCIDCGKRLKKRFEDRVKVRRCYNPCYINYESRRGHHMKGARRAYL